MLENKTDAIIPDTNPVVFALGVETLEIGDLLEGSGGLHLLDDFLDSPEQRGVGDRGKVRIERFAKGRVHAARSRRRKIFFRLVGGDFSPSWIARKRASSSKLSWRASRRRSWRSSRTSTTASLSNSLMRRSSRAVTGTK